MLKRFVVLGAVALTACGTEPGSQSPPGGSNPAGGGPVATVPLNALSLGTTNYLKVVLNSTKTVLNQVCNVNSGAEECNQVACSAASPCDTLTYPGASCPNGSFCTTTATVPTIFFARDATAASLAAGIPVPCLAGSYSMEVFGVAATFDAGGKVVLPVTIQETHRTPFVVDAQCNVTGLGWTAGTGTATDTDPWPQLSIPTIYAGLGFPPYDTYRLTPKGFTAPWGSWTAYYKLNGGGSAIYPDPTTRLFTAPATSPSLPLQFTGLFYLTSSRLLAGQKITDWVLQLPAVSVTPVSTGVVPLP